MSTKKEAPTTEKKITKHSLVKSHLHKQKFITSWDAIKLYKATRLSAIIFNLRKDGYSIESKPMASKDSYGNTCNYVKYVLIKAPK